MKKLFLVFTLTLTLTPAAFATGSASPTPLPSPMGATTIPILTPTVTPDPNDKLKPGFTNKDININDRTTLFYIFALVAVGGLVLYLTRPK